MLTPFPTSTPDSPACSGDFVEPFGQRDFLDFLQLLKYYEEENPKADINKDGEINIVDIQLELYFLFHDSECS